MPDSVLEDLMSELTSEQLIRVATSDPDHWLDINYGYEHSDPKRCLMGHVFDVECLDTWREVKANVVDRDYWRESIYRQAESEYMELKGRIQNEIPVPSDKANRLAGRVCIHLAWRELRSRSDSAAQDFLSRVQSGATIAPRPLTPARR